MENPIAEVDEMTNDQFDQFLITFEILVEEIVKDKEDRVKLIGILEDVRQKKKPEDT